MAWFLTSCLRGLSFGELSLLGNGSYVAGEVNETGSEGNYSSCWN